MKKLLVLVGFLFACSFVLGDISVSEPLDVYNLGDRIYVYADGLVGQESGNLNFDLRCGNRTTNLARLPASSFSFEDEASWNFYKILRQDDLQVENLTEIVGDCQIVTSLGGSSVSTKVFKISKDVEVKASLDKLTYNPGEPITLKVNAVKANGDLLDGFVEVSNASVFSKAVNGGVVTEVFSMSETAEAGTYFLNVYAYDSDWVGPLNEGRTSVFFDINQVISSLVLSLSGEVAVPGESFSVGAELFDQSGVEMTGAVSLKLVSPEGEITEGVVQSGEFYDFEFYSNSTIGTWKIIASFNDKIEAREFEVAPFQKVDFEFLDSVLKVTNVGNVLYNKTIRVLIGEEERTLDLKMKVGEVRKFDIDAPDGEYEVVVDDGDSSINQQLLLTGNAISISGVKKGFFKDYFYVWIVLIIVAGAVAVILFRRYRKTETVGKEGFFRKIVGKIKGVPFRKNKVKGAGYIDNSKDSKFYESSKKKDGVVDMTAGSMGSAESTLVLKGDKYVSSVVSVSVKNYSELSDIAKETLQKAVGSSEKKRGLVDWRGDYIFIVFSPIVTKTYQNESLAVEAGMGILAQLNDYNKKFKDKIEFGIGVHVGELVASKVGGKLKYTSIGNTISFAKRISDSDSGKLVISDNVRKKLIRDLRVMKGKEVGGNQTYEVHEIRDKIANQAKLNDLLKRM